MVETRLTNAELQHVLKAFISLNLILYNFGWKQKTVDPIPQRQPFVYFSTNSPHQNTTPTKQKAATPRPSPVTTLYPELAKAIEENNCKIFCAKIKNLDNTCFLERAIQMQKTQLPIEDTSYHYSVAAGEILQATEIWQTLIIITERALLPWRKTHQKESHPFNITPLPIDPGKINIYHYLERIRLIKANIASFQKFLEGRNTMLKTILAPWMESHSHYDSPHPLHNLIPMKWFHKFVNFLQANYNKNITRHFTYQPTPRTGQLP